MKLDSISTLVIAISAFVSAIASILAAYKGYKNEAKIETTHTLVNGQTAALIDLTEKAAHAEGRLAEQAKLNSTTGAK